MYKNPLMTKNFVAGAAIAAHRIVKFGSADGVVVQAAAAGDLLVGVIQQPGGAANGDRCDVDVAGITEVEAGGTIARGTLVTADTDGKAIAAAPAADTNIRVIGVALVTAASGDIIPMLLAPGGIQGEPAG